MLGAYMREYEQVEALATQALELSDQHQLTWVTLVSRIALGDARSRLGRTTEGIELIRQGMVGLLEMASHFGASSYTAQLATAQEHAGALADAVETIEQALRVNPDEIYYRPEIFRIRGELRLKQGQSELAEADFHQAITLAQKMGAKAWELRTTMSLARLLAQQGRRDEARMILAEIYNWFTEGFDTADLKEAKALLDELSV